VFKDHAKGIMAETRNYDYRIDSEISKEQLREACTQDVEHLAELTKQLTHIIEQQEAILKKIDHHQKRILGILRCEIAYTFTR